MKRHLLALLISALIVMPMLPPALAMEPPFPDLRAPEIPDAKAKSLDELTSRFRVLVHSLPYLLENSLRSGDPLLTMQIRESTDALDTYLNAMGKSVGGSRQKEMFAKLMVGAQNLKKSVEANLRAIEAFRLVKQVLDDRSLRLVNWSILRSDEHAQDSPQQQTDKAPSFRKRLDDIRVGFLSAVVNGSVSVTCPPDEAHRNKSRAIWEETLKQADELAASATTDEEKRLAAILVASLHKILGLSRDVLVKTDDLNQSWEKTLAHVASLEELLAPPAAKKEPAPATEQGKRPAKK